MGGWRRIMDSLLTNALPEVLELGGGQKKLKVRGVGEAPRRKPHQDRGEVATEREQ